MLPLVHNDDMSASVGHKAVLVMGHQHAAATSNERCVHQRQYRVGNTRRRHLRPVSNSPDWSTQTYVAAAPSKIGALRVKLMLPISSVVGVNTNVRYTKP